MSMAFFSVWPPPQRPHGHLPLNQRRSGGLCAPVHGSHALERADHARRPQQAILITGPCHRRTDKLALTISIGDSSAIRPASTSPRIVEDLAGSLCRPRREQSVPFHRLGWRSFGGPTAFMDIMSGRRARCGRVRPADWDDLSRRARQQAWPFGQTGVSRAYLPCAQSSWPLAPYSADGQRSGRHELRIGELTWLATRCRIHDMRKELTFGCSVTTGPEVLGIHRALSYLLALNKEDFGVNLRFAENMMPRIMC